ncbi:hypothetical protein [Polymorphobacter sp.]|uniref:hypothetical protein n=1 Tax=Polymorphobacter sp. TaxID=1909290 RepID=UPI003F6E52DE
MNEKPETLTKNQARAGETRGKMRYVLIISVILAVIALVWIAFGTGTPPQDDRAVGPTSDPVDEAVRDPGTGQAPVTE